MNFNTFNKSINQSQPDATLPIALQALWYDAKEDWDKAHHLADRIGGRKRPNVSLDEEWEIITKKLLELTSEST